MRLSRAAAAAIALVAAGIMTAPASASIILLNNTQLQGQGLGSTTTALTLQSPGSTATETGGVNLGGPFGDALQGSSQWELFTLAQLGISNANQLAMVVNLAEPGNDNTVTLNSLTLTAFSAGGATTTFNLAPGLAGTTLTQVANGLGGSGIVFGLDAPQAAQLTNLGLSTQLGLSASFGNAQGAPDAIQVASLTQVAAIPEPSTWAMMILGFAGLGYMTYRKRKTAARAA